MVRMLPNPVLAHQRSDVDDCLRCVIAYLEQLSLVLLHSVRGDSEVRAARGRVTPRRVPDLSCSSVWMA
jgi:hypothetical protein